MRRQFQIVCGVGLALGLLGAQDQQGRTNQNHSSQAQAPATVGNETFDRRAEEAAVAEQRIRQRDLAAQEDMANAAESQLAEIKMQTLTLWMSVVFGSVASLASVSALIIAIGTNRRQLAAYALPEVGRLMDGRTVVPRRSDRHDWPGVALNIKNFGVTPAYDVRGFVGITILETGDEASIPKLGEFLGGSPIPPGHLIVRNADLGRKMTTQEIQDIRSGEKSLYVYGQLNYVDIFRRKRFTKVRLTYTGAWPPPSNHALLFCTNGNETDEQRLFLPDP